MASLLDVQVQMSNTACISEHGSLIDIRESDEVVAASMRRLSSPVRQRLVRLLLEAEGQILNGFSGSVLQHSHWAVIDASHSRTVQVKEIQPKTNLKSITNPRP